MKTFHHPDPALNGLKVQEPMTYERVRRMFSIDPKTGLFLRKLQSKRYPLGGTTRRVGTADSNGYMKVMIEGRSYSAAKLMWLYHYRAWPTHRLTFINGFRNQYQIDNLKETTGKYV